MKLALRKLLFLAFVTCHVAVTVCGPCLHDIAGSSDRLGVTAKSPVPGDTSQPRDHNADNCLICHYVAQGLLSVDLVTLAVVPHVFELVIPECPALPSSPAEALSHPRAPPAVLS